MIIFPLFLLHCTNRTLLLLFPPHCFLLLIVYGTVGSAWHIAWPILPNTAPKECLIILVLIQSFSFDSKPRYLNEGKPKLPAWEADTGAVGTSDLIKRDQQRMRESWQPRLKLRHENTWYTLLLKHSYRIMKSDWLSSVLGSQWTGIDGGVPAG